jgi:hypothetical protein
LPLEQIYVHLLGPYDSLEFFIKIGGLIIAREGLSHQQDASSQERIDAFHYTLLQVFVVQVLECVAGQDESEFECRHLDILQRLRHRKDWLHIAVVAQSVTVGDRFSSSRDFQFRLFQQLLIVVMESDI